MLYSPRNNKLLFVMDRGANVKHFFLPHYSLYRFLSLFLLPFLFVSLISSIRYTKKNFFALEEERHGGKDD